MKFFKALFIRRLNRFVVECILEGKTIKAHLPNPGRLWELLLPGRILYLRKSQSNKLPYTVWATEKDGSIICLNTQHTNLVAERLIREKAIPAFNGYRVKKREFRIGNHRIDLLLEGETREMPLEVKSCTLFEDSIAMFPDATTERGRRHLELIAENKGAILFIVHSPQVRYFLPDFHTDPLFSETLYRLRNHLTIKTVSVRWDEDMELSFVRELSIPWHVYEREAGNRGAYIITGHLRRSSKIDIGSLGRLGFHRGYYLYTGSAMNSLEGRLRRHQRRNKAKRWHIDYLLPYLEGIRFIPIQTSQDIECVISEEIEQISDGYVKGFGSSDCRCSGHLFWMKDNPLRSEKFIDLILEYRIGRLKNLIEF